MTAESLDPPQDGFAGANMTRRIDSTLGARARRYSGHDRAGPSKNAMKAKMFGEHDEATVKQIETCIEAGG